MFKVQVNLVFISHLDIGTLQNVLRARHTIFFVLDFQSRFSFRINPRNLHWPRMELDCDAVSPGAPESLLLFLWS